MTRAPARVCDRLLDSVLVAFAAWTVIYHVCLVARIGSGWAAGAWGAVLLAGAVLAAVRVARHRRSGPRGAVRTSHAKAWPHPAWHVLAGLGIVLAVAAGAVFGLGDVPYRIVWIAWLVASSCVLLWGIARARVERTPDPSGSWLEAAVVAAWAVALAVFSLLLLDPDADDTFYVHLSSWIAAHGVFPIRDVVFSDQVFPALYYPPVFSYEALAGTLSRLTGLAVPDLVYYVIPPAGTVLSVLAFWRLLRAWRVPMAALALSTTLVFLLFDAGHHMTFGSFFVSRMWQGKVLLLCIVVPVLFALLHAYADRPSWRRAAMLLAGGIAAVGLSTTAIFLVPVIAGGSMVAAGLRSPRAAASAAAGFAAAAAYPIAAGAVTKLGGGRTPDVYTLADVVPANLVHYVLGTGGFALLGLAAALAGPATLRRASATPMVAGTVLLVGVLVSPGVPAFVFQHTGLGRVLWRLTWALPVAALVGALATGWLWTRVPAVLRAAPAVALCAAMALFGVAVWSPADGTQVKSHPVLKRDPARIATTRAILRVARPGDLILASHPLSQTLLIFSGHVTTVSPRGFFTRALSDAPGMHVVRRRSLQYLVERGVAAPPASRERRRTIRRNLRIVGVDLVCLPRWRVYARRLVGSFGFRRVLRTHRIACQRAPTD